MTEGEMVKCEGCGCETVVVGGFVRNEGGEWVKAEPKPYHSCGGER